MVKRQKPGFESWLCLFPAQAIHLNLPVPQFLTCILGLTSARLIGSLWDAIGYCASGIWNIPCDSIYCSDPIRLQVPSLPDPAAQNVSAS